MKLTKKANRTDHPMSCDGCLRVIQPGGRYVEDDHGLCFCVRVCAIESNRALDVPLTVDDQAVMA